MQNRLNLEKTHYHLIPNNILYGHLSAKKMHKHACARPYTDRHRNASKQKFYLLGSAIHHFGGKAGLGISKIIILKKMYELKRKVTNGDKQ
jgi:hypothetical protein